MSNDPGAGRVVIISGPSGAGKSSIVKTLLERCPLPLTLSVSATTRAPREGEQAGIDYHFLSWDEFSRRQREGEFLESKEVFRTGDWYGTLREEVTSGLKRGKWVILEIDVEGMAAALEHVPHAVTIFVHPGSLNELEQRLRDRKTETEERIQRRLEVARRELAQIDQYQHQVVNRTGEMEATVDEICRILTQVE